MRCGAASIADQENAVVQASGMRVGDIGIGAFDTARKVGRNEQVENAVDAVGCNALAALLRDEISNIIGRCRLFERRQHRKDIGSHLRPLLASVSQRNLRCLSQCAAAMFVVMMRCHDLNLGDWGGISK
jgi:hypothetical protein